MAQEAAQDGGDQLGSGTAEASRLPQDELIRVLGGQALESDFPPVEALGEEAADRGQVIRNRARLDAALVQQEALIGPYDPLERVIARRIGLRGRDAPGGSEQIQELAAGCRVAASPPLRFASGMEALELIVIELIDSQLPGREPAAQIRSELQFLPGREGRVAFGCEPTRECVDIVG